MPHSTALASTFPPVESLGRFEDALLLKIIAFLPLDSILAMAHVNARFRGLLQMDTTRPLLIAIGNSRGVPSPPFRYQVLRWWRLLIGLSFLCEACGRESVPLNFSILRHLCSQCTFFASRTPHTFQEVFGESYSKFNGSMERLLYLECGFSVFVPPQYLWDDPTKCLPPPNEDLSPFEVVPTLSGLKAVDVRQRIPFNVDWWQCSLQGRCFEIGIQASPSLWALLEILTGWNREQTLLDVEWHVLRSSFEHTVHGTLCTAIVHYNTPYSRRLSDALAAGVARLRNRMKPTSRILPASRALLAFRPLVEMIVATHEDLLTPRMVSDFLYEQRAPLLRAVDVISKRIADTFIDFEDFHRAYHLLSPSPFQPPSWKEVRTLAVVQVVCNTCGHISVTVAAFLNHLNAGSSLCIHSSWDHIFSLNPGLAAPALVMLADLDPSTASADEMDDLSYIYRCQLCPDHPRHVTGSWREMVSQKPDPSVFIYPQLINVLSRSFIITGPIRNSTTVPQPPTLC
ncbi:hypothetical protein V5O48_003948 [Marasmius crinis-equi]|uniref:F-box domain-containing protein n=1 Tax=Marasmius crinis-equi TaxID=585013 RepID=A0ABR3FSC4_9AGAR